MSSNPLNRRHFDSGSQTPRSDFDQQAVARRSAGSRLSQLSLRLRVFCRNLIDLVAGTTGGNDRTDPR